MSNGTKIVTSIPIKLLANYKKEYSSIDKDIDNIVSSVDGISWDDSKCIMPSLLLKTAIVTSQKSLHGKVISNSVLEWASDLCYKIHTLYCFNRSKYVLNIENTTWRMLMNTGKQEKDKSINIDILECLPYNSFYIHLDNHSTLDGALITRDTVYAEGFASDELDKGHIIINLINKDASKSRSLTLSLSGGSLPIKDTFKCIRESSSDEEYLNIVNSIPDILKYIGYDICEVDDININNMDSKEVNNLIDKYTDFTSGICQLLYYICTLTADAVKIKNPVLDNPSVLNINQSSKKSTKKSKSKCKNKNNKLKLDYTYYDIGYRLGPELKKHEENSKSYDNEDKSFTNTKKLPHIRRGHFHTYHVGKGRKNTIVKWIAPTYINGTGFITELPVTQCKVENHDFE